MKQINAVNFAPFGGKGAFASEAARDSLRLMSERTACNTVIFTPSGFQETPQSEKITFGSEWNMPDSELSGMTRFAQSLGLDVILKPTVNCLNGVWRAFVNFFDNEVPPEPKWSEWFKSHIAFHTHYAKLARETGCVMYITGCEMVMAERKSEHWRELVSLCREASGLPVSYNTDKYQEDAVDWWDAADVISSSGYYPFGSWKTQLDRIEAVVKRFGKPFFFAEIGCMSAAGSGDVPNDWQAGGDPDNGEQARWYGEMFRETSARDWVGGYGLWSWQGSLSDADEKGYSLYGKSAEEVVREWFGKARTK
ncbi:MAG: 1,4-beta-xylanase [Oscillospiraceae bacterium]|jgi:hypothetical protein|nr:1,4-beta-xylanase [Oscillospiraceae bacterium]